MTILPLRNLAPALLALFATSACFATPASEPQPDGPDETVESPEAADFAASKSKGSIDLLVTVDWEGTDLEERNLSAMEDLRALHPEVRMVHFLNAAYYTKRGADPVAITAAFRRVIRPGDELGLHLHGWKRLFEAAGVTFRRGPTFWGTPLTTSECATDCGHDVPISEYQTRELEKVIAFSVDTLAAHGFGRATSFRAGGWLASVPVRAALANQLFKFDHSAVPSTFLQGELTEGGTPLPLLTSVRSLWAGTTKSSQPFRILADDTKDTRVAESAKKTIVEVPDNGALADYVTAREMLTVFDGAVTTLRRAPATDRVVSIGFHQETAADYLPRIQGALDGIAQRISRDRVPVRFVTSSGLPRVP